MPGGDGTGPMGLGPMTGRAMGYCVTAIPGGGGRPYGYAGLTGWPVSMSPFYGAPPGYGVPVYGKAGWWGTPYSPYFGGPRWGGRRGGGRGWGRGFGRGRRFYPYGW